MSIYKQLSFFAEYYDEEEKKEVETLLKLWAKYHKRNDHWFSYGLEEFTDKPHPIHPSRTLCITINITTPSEKENATPAPIFRK